MNDKPPIDDAFNQSASKTPTLPKDVKWVAQPVSKKQIDDLHKLLSRPRLACELTPMGPVTRQVRHEEDQKILDKIEQTRQRLEMRRNAAKEAFERAKHNKTHRPGPRR
jgi:hypothetical protein